MKFSFEIKDDKWKWDWHIWFAWHPVFFIEDNEYVFAFLEKVYRRKNQIDAHGGEFMQYRKVK